MHGIAGYERTWNAKTSPQLLISNPEHVRAGNNTGSKASIKLTAARDSRSVIGQDATGQDSRRRLFGAASTSARPRQGYYGRQFSSVNLDTPFRLEFRSQGHLHVGLRRAEI
jgi:hypothetical protein